jgi:hypothetical protein
MCSMKKKTAFFNDFFVILFQRARTLCDNMNLLINVVRNIHNMPWCTWYLYANDCAEEGCSSKNCSLTTSQIDDSRFRKRSTKYTGHASIVFQIVNLLFQNRSRNNRETSSYPDMKSKELAGNTLVINCIY